jgi:F-type H+-transporting ATPase subunit b
MPQLDWSTFLSQAFWLIVCFCTLWFLLSEFVMPKLANVVEQRKRKIDDYVQKADALSAAAKASLNKYNETLATAKAEAEKKLNDGKIEIKNQLSETERKMTAELNQKIADNEFLLASEKKDTMLQIENIAQDLAYNILQKLGFVNISQHDVAMIAQKEKENG